MKKVTLTSIPAGLFSAFLCIVPALMAGCSGRPVHQDAAPGQEAAPDKASQASSPSNATGQSTQKIVLNDQRSPEASAEYHFSLAQAYVAEGNPDRAIEEYKLTLMYDPHSALVYARLATEYVKKGMLSAAMETCKEALQRDSNFVDARLMLAGLYSTAHETQAALTEYDRVLKIDPKHEEAAVYKSQVLLEDGRGKESTQFLRQFVKKVPDSALGWYYLGRAEQHEGQYKEAVRAYTKAMEVREGFSQAALALGYLYEERQMNAQAIATYKELFDESQDSTAANRLATIYLKEEKYQQAVPYLEALANSDGDDMNVRVKLGLVQMELKDYEKAIQTFSGILSKNPDSDRIHYYLGSLYEEIKKFDDAIAQLKQIKPASKLYGDAALHVAYLLKQGNKAADARGFIKEAISKSPETSSFYVFEASMDEEAKDVPGAISVLESAAQKFPEDEKIRYYLGSLYDRQGNIDKGLEQMEAILKINPENVDALNYIGYTWTQKGVRLNDAEKLLRHALTLRPDNGYIQDSWGWYLFVRGRVREAVVELEKAARLKPNEPTILEHLGDAYLRSNLREKALQEYSDAAKFADDEDSRKKLRMKVQDLEKELVQQGTIPAGSSGDGARMPASSPRTP